MKLSRDTWLALGLFLLLSLVTVGAAIQQSRDAVIPYLGDSSSPNGARALKLWLNELGIQTVEDTPSAYEPPQNAELIFILEPLFEITENEWKLLDHWVENGGTLILAGSGAPTFQAFIHYRFDVYSMEKPKELAVQTPLLTSPPLTAPLKLAPRFYLQSERSDYIAHLAYKGLPVLVSFDEGGGRVILSTEPLPFSNLGLKDAENAALVLNLIALSANSPRVAWLDEWHHGVRPNTIVGPGQWLRATPIGHALLFIVWMIFLALLMRGRAFGRPIPLPHEIKRRGPLEYVTAIANLNRKAGHRAAVMEQYRHRLKRQLGRRYRLDPSMPDAKYIEALARLNPSLDTEALAQILKRLTQKNPSEGDIVKIAAEASKWINGQ